MIDAMEPTLESFNRLLCPTCGKTHPKDARFCPETGQPIPAQEPIAPLIPSVPDENPTVVQEITHEPTVLEMDSSPIETTPDIPSPIDNGVVADFQEPGETGTGGVGKGAETGEKQEETLQADGQLCPHCHRFHPAAAKFCPVTGEPIPAVTVPQEKQPELEKRFCPCCGKPIALGWNHCPSCGGILSDETKPVVKRKQRWGWVIAGFGIGACLLFSGMIWTVWKNGSTISGGLDTGWEQVRSRLLAVPGISNLFPSTPTSTPISTQTPSPIRTLTPDANDFTATPAQMLPMPGLPASPTSTSTSTPAPTSTPTVSIHVPGSTLPSIGSVKSSQGPCVSFYDEGNGVLKYACLGSMGWELPEIVDRDGNVGLYTSLAYDSEGSAYISYYDKTNGDLKLAKRTKNGLQQKDTIDRNGDVGLFTSMAIDSQGNLSISYLDRTRNWLKYARLSGDSLSIEDVAPVGPIDTDRDSSCTSLKVDDKGVVRVAYYDGSSETLKVTQRTSDGWDSPQKVDNEVGAGQYCSLAMDRNGNPGISYYSSKKRDLKYAHGTNGSWLTPQVVDSAGDVGAYSSLAYGPDNNPRISYLYEDRDFLKYAHWTGRSWLPESVDIHEHVGSYTSLALDSKGNPFIAYYYIRDKLLYVATFEDGKPKYQKVDSADRIGRYSSIAFPTR
jgi:predicted nucleic acid-binding Zn ribbon protein